MRFYGQLGYGESSETPPGSGIWVDSITERDIYGDVAQNTRQLVPDIQSLNGDISSGSSISVVADQYAVENFLAIRFVRWDGVLWTVTNVEVRRPRLILSLGSNYNGPVGGE